MDFSYSFNSSDGLGNFSFTYAEGGANPPTVSVMNGDETAGVFSDPGEVTFSIDRLPRGLNEFSGKSSDPNEPIQIMLDFCQMLDFSAMGMTFTGDRLIVSGGGGFTGFRGFDLETRDIYSLDIEDTAVVPLEEVKSEARFVRGDASSNGSLEIGDGILILGFLFLGRSPPACFDAAHVTDEGTTLGLGDAVFLFG